MNYRTILVTLTFCAVPFLASGCSAIGAAAGAAIDAVVLTAPLWGPSAATSHKIGKVEKDLAVGTTLDPKHPPTTVKAPSAPDIALRIFEGPDSGRNQKPGYYPCLAMVPLVPYANKESVVERAWSGEIPEEIQGAPPEGGMEIRIPVDRLPEGLRPSEEDGISPLTRAAAMDLVRGEIASRAPTASDCAVAYYHSQKDTFLFGLTAFAREHLARELPSKDVRLELPAMVGRFGLVTPKEKEPTFPGEKRKKDDDNKDKPKPPTLALTGNELVTVIPSDQLRVFAQPKGYAAPQAGTVVITGKVTSLRLQVSHISYCVTSIGANFLSFLGLPLANNRLVMEVKLEAHRGGESVLAQQESIKTSHEAVGLYYGRDYAKNLSEELQGRFAEILSEFAADLSEKI